MKYNAWMLKSVIEDSTLLWRTSVEFRFDQPSVKYGCTPGTPTTS